MKEFLRPLVSLLESAKFWLAFVGFLLALVQLYVPGAPWYAPLVAFLTAIGVYSVPNKSK